jgi:hypothetical protein
VVSDGSTDPGGQFETIWLPAGRYVVTAEPSDMFKGSSKEVSIGGRSKCVFAVFQLAPH